MHQSDRHVKWLVEAASSIARLEFARFLCQSWLLTDPEPGPGPDPLPSSQISLLDAIIKILLLHLNGRSPERILAVDASAYLIQWAQNAVLKTSASQMPSNWPMFSPATASSTPMAQSASQLQLLRQHVLHGPTDLDRCSSAAALQLAWKISMLIPELCSAVSGLLAGTPPASETSYRANMASH